MMSTAEAKFGNDLHTPHRLPVLQTPAPRPEPRSRLPLLWAALGGVAVVAGALSLVRESSAPVPEAKAPLAAPERDWADKPAQPTELATVLSLLYKEGARPADAPDAGPPAAFVPEPPARPEAGDLADLERTRAAQDLGEAASTSAADRGLLDPSAQANPGYVGIWAPVRAACAPRNPTRFLPAWINPTGARAGEVSCAFANGRREGTTWSFRASCSDGRRSWTANVRLAVNGDTLTWSSERGSQRYARCPGG
ncbi:MAG TPA: hypothetical protein VIL65_10075 [Beijerinckiaceae bacterium]|jgi:hypothetical protein